MNALDAFIHLHLRGPYVKRMIGAKKKKWGKMLFAMRQKILNIE